MHEIRADKQVSNGAGKISRRTSLLGAAFVFALGANVIAASSGEFFTSTTSSLSPSPALSSSEAATNSVVTYNPTFTPAFAPSNTELPIFSSETAPANTTPVNPVSSSEVASNALAVSESTVHHIRTTTNYEDGYQEVRHGTGFVVGQKFFTVFHNIDVLKNHGTWEREIDLGGMLVEPRIVDRRNDIAIFDLPTVLCRSWCNDRDLGARQVGLEQEQAIGWYEFVSPDDERRWRQARIKEVMFKNYQPSTADAACQSDVVIAVDQPFYPGSSGGPVWDLASHRLLGMVQGSFVRESGEQVGYYKPFSCVQSLLTGTIGPASVDLASKF